MKAIQKLWAIVTGLLVAAFWMVLVLIILLILF